MVHHADVDSHHEGVLSALPRHYIQQLTQQLAVRSSDPPTTLAYLSSSARVGVLGHWHYFLWCIHTHTSIPPKHENSSSGDTASPNIGTLVNLAFLSIPTVVVAQHQPLRRAGRRVCVRVVYFVLTVMPSVPAEITANDMSRNSPCSTTPTVSSIWRYEIKREVKNGIVACKESSHGSIKGWVRLKKLGPRAAQASSVQTFSGMYIAGQQEHPTPSEITHGEKFRPLAPQLTKHTTVTNT